MTSGDEFDDIPTRPDGTNIPVDADMEGEFTAEEVTPAQRRGLDSTSCWRCRRPVVHLMTILPPGSVREAEAYDACVRVKDSSWALCAAQFMIRFWQFEFYFGPDRRAGKTLPDPAFTGPERRKVHAPPAPAFPPRSPSQEVGE